MWIALAVIAVAVAVALSAVKYPDVGVVAMCDHLTTAIDPAEIKLFKNNYTPVAGTTLANLTEADFSGYASVVLAGWTAAAIGAGGRAYSQADLVTFAHNGGVTANSIYGYWVVDSGGTLLWAERFATAPITMSGLGDSIVVIPQTADKSEF